MAALRAKKPPPQPFLHRLQGEEIFSFADPWIGERQKDSDERVVSMTIITTDVQDPTIAKVHHRQPVVLDGSRR